MDISPLQIKIIKDTVRHFDPQAEIILYGARLGSDAGGGELHLLVKSAIIGQDDQRIIRNKLVERLRAKDVGVVLPTDKNLTLVAFAENEGISL